MPTAPPIMQRAPMRVLPEMEYYSQQTKTAGPIRFGGNVIATVMSIGAVLAAMNTSTRGRPSIAKSRSRSSGAAPRGA